MSEQQQQEEYVDPMIRIEEFFSKWSDFSVAFGVSPGPLYTAGANAVADVIRREAQEALKSLEALKSEIEHDREDLEFILEHTSGR